jgi:hypothetical protein
MQMARILKPIFSAHPMFPDKPYISNGLINPRKDKLSFVSLRVGQSGK